MKPSKKNFVVILLGPPGSGKGTQARMIQEKFDLDYIGSGKLLRARASKNDYTGKKIGDVIHRGERVPTPVVFKIWMEEFEKIKRKGIFKGLVVDGSPRTIFEAKMMEEALNWYSWYKETKIFFIKISKKEAIERLAKRRICKSCGEGSLVKESLSECSKCGGVLVARKDDTVEAINLRWGWYKREVMPTVRFYQKKKNFFEIDGNQSIDDVFKDILKKLKK